MSTPPQQQELAVEVVGRGSTSSHQKKISFRAVPLQGAEQLRSFQSALHARANKVVFVPALNHRFTPQTEDGLTGPATSTATTAATTTFTTAATTAAATTSAPLGVAASLRHLVKVSRPELSTR